MKRRELLKGMVLAAVAAAIPASTIANVSALDYGVDASDSLVLLDGDKVGRGVHLVNTRTRETMRVVGVRENMITVVRA